MNLYRVGRFRAQESKETELAQAIRDLAEPRRAEAGCRSFGAFRSKTDPLLFYIHSRWVSKDAFATHARLPHTLRFIKIAERLIDHPLDVTRAVSFV